MRKMLNKKGFSLVELMIVVVIMGILVAVAIPLYGAITDKAEKNTCQDNQRTINAAFANYCVSDATRSSNTLLPGGADAKYSSKDGGTGNIDEEYLKSFPDDALPVCPIEGNYYEITKVRDFEIKIVCKNADGSLCTKHNTEE